MKRLLLVLALIFSGDVFATDYTPGQCPVAANCNFGAGQPAASPTYSDTFTVTLGNWGESYGTYDYTSSLAVVVSGSHGVTPCSGRGCHGQAYSVTVDSATLDGAPMTQLDPYHWKTSVSLSAGPHLIAVTGTVTGATWYGREGGTIQGIQYTLVPNPPCSGDSCDGE